MGIEFCRNAITRRGRPNNHFEVDSRNRNAARIVRQATGWLRTLLAEYEEEQRSESGVADPEEEAADAAAAEYANFAASEVLAEVDAQRMNDPAPPQLVIQVTESPPASPLSRPPTPANVDSDDDFTMDQIAAEINAQQAEDLPALTATEQELVDQLTVSGAFSYEAAVSQVLLAQEDNISMTSDPVPMDETFKVLEPARPAVQGGECSWCLHDGAAVVAVHPAGACLCACLACLASGGLNQNPPCPLCREVPLAYVAIRTS